MIGQSLVFILMITTSGILISVRCDYILNNHFMQVEYVNHNWINSFTIKNVKPNRTYRAFDLNLHLHRSLGGDKFKARLQAYWFLSNEYKKSPILFDVKVCGVLKRRNCDTDQFFVKGNFSTCPLQQGIYFVKQFTPLGHYFTLNMPKGEYMVEIKLILPSIVLATMKWYGSIVTIENLRRDRQHKP